MMTHPVHMIVVSIERSWREVYDYAADPASWPAWAAGLGAGFERSGEEWTARDPAGHPIRIRFSPRNALGVLDHDVRAPDGTVTHNAMRVTPSGDGAVVSFTLLRTPGMSDEVFASDAAAVQRDLQALKALLER